ncbi:hypothetical protein J5N97_001221 [Dioscorea zingiberensis]|uniref:Uncharacterized protein n=1 Tax=Dioscorea zingiberensis TaxID=325984 RepID=A0A9D5H2I2_9LILI|nr:hypothetical protein J5N97_001221 [Dioscorea zingiberensis]
MTVRGTSSNGGKNKDLTGEDSMLANHSSMHFESSTTGSMSSISPTRRQSPRLKRINAVYESADSDSSKLHQPSNDIHSLVTRKIKAEVLHEEGSLIDNPKSSCILNAINIDPDGDSDDPSIISMTLKDIRARCKAKKRKLLKPNASMFTYFKSQSSPDLSPHSSEEPEEDTDLNLPLISLKMKVARKSSPGIKGRCVRPSEHAICVGRINTETCPISDISAKSESSGGEEDSQVVTRKNIIEINNSFPPVIRKLEMEPEPLNINKFLENGSWDVGDALDVGGNSSLSGNTKIGFHDISNQYKEGKEAEFSEESIFFTNRFQNFCANDSIGNTGHNSSPKAVAQALINVHADNPELAYHIKSEILDVVNHEGENTLFIANSSNVDFIAEFDCPVNLSMELDGGDENDLRMEELNCSIDKISGCCVTEVSMEHMKSKCLSECTEEVFCTGISEQVATSRVPPGGSNCIYTTDIPLEGSVYDKNLNQSNDFCENVEITNCVPLKVIEDHGNFAGEEQAQELSACSIRTDVAVGEPHDSTDPFGPENKFECLGNMVGDVLTSNLLTKHNKGLIFCDSRGHSENGTYDLCSQEMNQLKDGNISHRVAAMELVNDIHDCGPSKAIEDHSIVVDDEQSKKLPICSINTDGSIVSSKHFREFHDSGDTSAASANFKCLDNIVADVHEKDLQTNSNERCILSHTSGHSENGTYDLCSQKLDACFSNGFSSHMTNDSLQKTDFLSGTLENNNVGKITCDSVELANASDTEEVRITVDCHSHQCSAPCSGSFCVLQFTDDSASEVGENFLSPTIHSVTDAAADKPTCPRKILPMDDKNNNTQMGFNLDQSIDGLEHTPEKLLSNRKTISPTSQEKLCMAVNGIDLHDALQSSKTRKRLWYENYSGNEVPSTVSGLKEIKPILGSDRTTKKPKNRNGSLPSAVKGILKSDVSSRSPCSCMKGSPAHKQTQNAIEFSQRQMHDIEGVAMRLLNGLKSMKSIVQGNMFSEDCLPTTPKFTTDEIREALEKASNLEEYTKKWLTIMARDCNRFCKIMVSLDHHIAFSFKLSNCLLKAHVFIHFCIGNHKRGDKKAASPVKGPRKEGKKISFADEAGGLLCHIKVFE